jgi:thymidine phosphorylase
MDVTAETGGYVVDIEPMAIALTANRLGAGRARKGDPIDHAVGLELLGQVGEPVAAGDAIARVHARTEAAAVEAVAAVRSAIVLGPDTPVTRSIVLDRYSTER